MNNLNYRSENMVPWGDAPLYPPRVHSSPSGFGGCYRHDSDILEQTTQRLRSLRLPGPPESICCGKLSNRSNMKPTYNIYRQLAGNTLAWVERVNGLQQAEESVGRWAHGFPGNYIIFDVRERKVVWAGNALQQFAIPGLKAIIGGNEGSR